MSVGLRGDLSWRCLLRLFSMQDYDASLAVSVTLNKDSLRNHDRRFLLRAGGGAMDRRMSSKAQASIIKPFELPLLCGGGSLVGWANLRGPSPPHMVLAPGRALQPHATRVRLPISFVVQRWDSSRKGYTGQRSYPYLLTAGLRGGRPEDGLIAARLRGNTHDSTPVVWPLLAGEFSA